MKTTPYLYFKGDCEAALTFYAGCGLGEIQGLMRYDAAPMGGPADWAPKIMHAVLEGPGLRLHASDTAEAEVMKGCAILIEHTDVAASAALFEKLAEGGRVTMPFAQQFWGDHYGNFTDRFGVQWALNCTPAA